MDLRVIIYSAILNDYDALAEPHVPQSAGMVLFTDKPNKEYDGAWKICNYDRQYHDPCRDARWIKTHPHQMMPDADIIIWIDGSVELKVDLGAMAEKLLGDNDIAIYNHNLRKCIYQEANACIKFEKDDSEVIKSQINRYEKEKFPHGFGLVSSGIVIRRNKKDDIIEFNNMWWDEIKNGSRRDQLSFDYCRWKLGISHSAIPGNIYDERLCKLNRYHKPKKKIENKTGLDVFLVKYCDNEQDDKMWSDTHSYISSSDVNLKVWDNNKDNIGLVAARLKLLEESNAKYICFMDFDFRGLCIDWKSIQEKLDEKNVGMVVPWTPPADIDNNLEWEEKKYIQCSMMIIRRDVLDAIGMDSSFNTAYGDWDLIKRLWDADYKIMQHNKSFAIHAPSPKNGNRTELWKKDYNAYIAKHKEPMKRREQLPRIVVADSNGTHFKWLNNFCDYLTKRNFGVQKVNGWGKDVNWWKDVINGASMVFLWNGAHPIFLPIIQASNELGVPYSILEVGWFPQSIHYFVDPTGINCRSSIMHDDLSWIGDRQYDRLDYLRRHYIGDKKWKGGDSVLVPLQLAEDMNWILDGNVGSMQDFINHVEQRFENVIFKRHPLDKNNYKTKSKMVTSGDFLEMAQEASLVYGVNSTCLLEATLMGVPVKSVGGGYLRAHESQTEVLLAALSDKQIHVDEKELDYWFGDILANNQEKVLGHSETSWNALSNSAIVIIPCRNCEKFIAECMDSLTSQTWIDLGIIVIDDCSDDKTSQVAREHLKGIEHLVIKNSKRRWALRNIDTAITAYCDNPNSVIFLLDGDDYLIDDRAIEKMMNSHKEKDVVWSSYKTDVKEWAHKGGMMDSRVPIRSQLWNMSPFRSFKKFLFDAIDRNHFIDSDGDYFKVTWDQAIMFPIAEMSGPSQWRFIPEQFYYYRMHENNDHNNDGRKEQIRAEAVVRKKPSAKLMERYNNSEVTVVVSFFNQLYVLPKFLESMFFQNKLPIEVIVADDGSSDEVCEWIEENAHRYPFKLSYVTREHDGYRLASLNNFASEGVTIGRILFTNADVIHCPDSIKAHSSIKGVAGGVVMGISTNRAKKVSMDDIRDYKALLKIQKSAPSWRQNMDYIKTTNPNQNPIGVWGGNFSVPAVKFHELGGFDEGFKGWGGEDNELVIRFIRAGCKVEWAMDSEVIHLDHENKKYALDQSGSSYYQRKMRNG